jgi:hypothetical protein
LSGGARRARCATLLGVSAAARPVSLAGAVVLGSLAALHLAWAAGATWPAGDRARLADSVAGLPRMPGRLACWIVAVGLGAAAAAVSGIGGRRHLVQFARVCIAAAFLVRGAAGVAGRTRWLIRWTPSARFVVLDRRYYGPLCLLIGASAAVSVADT